MCCVRVTCCTRQGWRSFIRWGQIYSRRQAFLLLRGVCGAGAAGLNHSIFCLGQIWVWLMQHLSNHNKENFKSLHRGSLITSPWGNFGTLWIRTMQPNPVSEGGHASQNGIPGRKGCQISGSKTELQHSIQFIPHGKGPMWSKSHIGWQAEVRRKVAKSIPPSSSEEKKFPPL